MATLVPVTPSGPAYSTAADTRAAIKTEALKAIDDVDGRPLPLVAHWHSTYLPVSWQLAKIADGYPIVPHIDWYKTWSPTAAGNDAFGDLATYELPFTLISTQYDQELLTNSAYTSQSDADTSQTVEAGGRSAAISPMGTTTAWGTLGDDWGGESYLASMQSQYANPPRLWFASNNEAQYLSFRYASNDTRYDATYGSGRTFKQKGEDFHDRYLERWQTLTTAWVAALTETDWAANCSFINYEAIGPRKIKYYREWPFSPNASKHDAMKDGAFNRLRWQYHLLGGELGECYDNHWEWNSGEYPNTCKAPWLVYSPQNEACNWKFAWDIAYSLNANYWSELIYWDGELFSGGDNDTAVKATDYVANGITVNPDYYKGWTQYCLWLAKPRVAREFRYSTTDVQSATYLPYYQKILDMVSHVHQNATLRRFWRSGTLLEHPTRQHPFEDGTSVSDSSITGTAWNGYPKWYHLPTSVDPALPAGVALYTNNENIEWPCYTLGHLIGTTPNREWLVYAHSTGISGSTLTNVTVTIPDFQDVILPSVPVEGAFYLLTESDAVYDETLTPSSIISLSGLTGSVLDLTDDPSAPDSLWLTVN